MTRELVAISSEIGTVSFTRGAIALAGASLGDGLVLGAERRAAARWSEATRAWVRRVVSIRQARAAAKQRGDPMPYVDFLREQRAALATGAESEIVVKLQADPPEAATERAAEEKLIREILAADANRLELSRASGGLVAAAERRAAAARKAVCG